MRTLLISACVLAFCTTASVLQGQAAAAPAAAPAPLIGILLPTNGATVTSPVMVRFRLVNYGVAPAGTAVERTGHFHLLIDSEAGEPGTIIPADDMHIHYGKGQIEVTVAVPLGRHTLRAVLGDHLHKVISSDLVSEPVTVRVVAGR